MLVVLPAKFYCSFDLFDRCISPGLELRAKTILLNCANSKNLNHAQLKVLVPGKEGALYPKKAEAVQTTPEIAPTIPARVQPVTVPIDLQPTPKAPASTEAIRIISPLDSINEPVQNTGGNRVGAQKEKIVSEPPARTKEVVGGTGPGLEPHYKQMDPNTTPAPASDVTFSMGGFGSPVDVSPCDGKHAGAAVEEQVNLDPQLEKDYTARLATNVKDARPAYAPSAHAQSESMPRNGAPSHHRPSAAAGFMAPPQGKKPAFDTGASTSGVNRRTVKRKRDLPSAPAGDRTARQHGATPQQARAREDRPGTASQKKKKTNGVGCWCHLKDGFLEALSAEVSTLKNKNDAVTRELEDAKKRIDELEKKDEINKGVIARQRDRLRNRIN